MRRAKSAKFSSSLLFSSPLSFSSELPDAPEARDLLTLRGGDIPLVDEGGVLNPIPFCTRMLSVGLPSIRANKTLKHAPRSPSPSMACGTVPHLPSPTAA